MYSLVFAVVVIYCVANGLALTNENCPQNLVRDKNLKVFGDACYQFETQKPEVFRTAHKQCFQQGGSLATVKTKTINDFLIQELNQTYQLSKLAVWIGLDYDDVLLKYYWVDATPLEWAYENFTGDGTCAAIQNNHWIGGSCDVKNMFICQFPIQTNKTKTLIPEPTHQPVSLKDCPAHLQTESHLEVFESKCYTFHTYKPLIFHDAVQACKANGGSLAMLKTKQIDRFVVQTMTGERPLFAWIGLRYFPLINSFKWFDGDKMTYSNIRAKVFQSSSNCVSLNPDDGVWEIRPCYKHYAYVCEYDGVTNNRTYNQTETTTSPTTTPRTPTTADCPVQSDTKDVLQILDQTCYFFSLNRRMTFDHAENFCQEYGGSLAMPKTKVINDFLHYHMVYTHGLLLHPGLLWIGLHYNLTGYDFLWLDGTPMSYQNFFYKSSFYDCAAISPKDGKWRDKLCDNKIFGEFGFICEFEAVGYSTPTSQSITTSQITASTAMITPTTTVTNSTPPITGSTEPCKVLNNCDLVCPLGFMLNPSTNCFECKCDE